MIGIVVSGHINFASGMASAVKAIAGQQENMVFIDFVESMSTDELEIALRQAAIDVNTGNGVLFLTDIPGGSPANRAMSIMMENNNVELIAGANLPMIANAAFERDGVTVEELVSTLLVIGQSTMQNLRQEFAKAMAQDDVEQGDGL